MPGQRRWPAMWAGRYSWSGIGARTGADPEPAPAPVTGAGGPGGWADGGMRWRERRVLRQWRPHHKRRNRPAPMDRVRPTPEMAVERTSKVDVSSTIEPSGLVTVTSSVNAPEVRTRTGTSRRVVPGSSDAGTTVPSGNSSWSLSSVTRTFRFWLVRFDSAIGMVLDREVSVMRNLSGSVTAPLTVFSAVLTRST